MNDVVKNFKKGHKIHIKESQKGTFTKWCGGNVTDECIQRGKNSSNPKIRKKATFAANARKWKHKDGGIIKAATGTQVNTDTTNNNNSKINWKSLLNTGVDYIGQMLPSILNSSGNSSSQQISDTSDAMTDTTLQYLLQQQQQAQAISDLDSILKSQYDPENPNANGGEIVRNHYKWLTLAPQQAQQKELQQQQKKLLDTQNKQKKARIINDALTTTLQTGLGLVSNYIGNKKGSSVS